MGHLFQRLRLLIKFGSLAKNKASIFWYYRIGIIWKIARQFGKIFQCSVLGKIWQIARARKIFPWKYMVNCPGNFPDSYKFDKSYNMCHNMEIVFRWKILVYMERTGSYVPMVNFGKKGRRWSWDYLSKRKSFTVGETGRTTNSHQGKICKNCKIASLCILHSFNTDFFT